MSAVTPEASREYWRRIFADPVEPLELPRDYARLPRRAASEGALPLAIDEDLTHGLSALSHRTGASRLALVVAAVKALLYRYTEQENIVVGTVVSLQPTPAAGAEAPALLREGDVAEPSRPTGDTAVRRLESVGRVEQRATNTLALRDRVNGSQPFVDLLRAVHQTVSDAVVHRTYPFERVLSDVAPARDPGHSPLFDVMVTFVPAGEEALAPPAVPCDLRFELREHDSGFDGSLHFDDRLFERVRVARLADHFVHLLRGLTADPQTRVADLMMMGEAERRRVLVEWNQTAAPYSENCCLHDLISAQASRTPNAVALAFEGNILTYAELEARSNQLARRLLQLGVGPDVRVGVCLLRSLELPIALLAVLKAGGAYVPLDPDYPPSRLTFMMRDAACPVLITCGSLRARLAEAAANDATDAAPSAVLVSLDEDDDELRALDESRLRDEERSATATPDHLAYVIYTSGSTGVPKGAMNTHRAVINRLEWMQTQYQIDASDCVLQKTPYSFDVSAWELFWPLMTGARMCLARPDGHKDPEYLIDLIEAQAVTVMHFVPSMLQVFLQHPRASACTHLRRVICSGEALPPDTAARFHGTLPAALHNLYGPTEAAIDVTHWTCHASALPPATIPIGRPIANAELYIVDEALRPVPIGVAGELLIGGVPVGRGYLGRPDLTAEKFIPNPFGAGRLYRSGDRCRYRTDGSVEFLGRLDDQVKLRGFRIELGEIESALAGCPGIAEAAVGIDGSADDARLTAYLVAAHDGELPAADDIEQRVRQRLPAYMIPARYVYTASLPRTSSGKLDRRTLRSISGSDTHVHVPYRAPGTALEETLAALWSEMLGVPRVGIDDDFFRLGGHSLSAARLIVGVRTMLRKEIALTDLYRTPTLHELARTIEAAPAAIESRVPLATVDQNHFPLSYGQLGFWLLAKSGAPHLNVIGRIRVAGMLDRDALAAALDRLIADHPALRSRVGRWVPHQRIQTHCARQLEERALFALDDAAMEAAALASLAELDRIDTWPPGAALARLRLLRLRPKLAELQLCMPHIVSDDVSLTIAFEDLSRHYLDVIEGRTPPTHSRDMALTRFVVEERERLRGRLAAETEFWDAYFEDVSPIVFPESDVLSAGARAESVYVEMPADIVDALYRTARAGRLGVADILHAATLRAIAPHVEAAARGRKQPVLMTPRSLRHEGAYDQAVGFFAHMDCVKAEIADAPDLLSLARRLGQTAIQTAPHQRVPLEVKSAALHRRRWLMHDRWCRLAARAATALMPSARVDDEVALAYARLAALRRTPTRDFAVIANVLHSFVTLDRAPLFGLPLMPVEAHPGDEPLPGVLELFFLREPHAADAYRLALSGQLTARFRRALAQHLIADLKTLCGDPIPRGASLEASDAHAQ
jgi:amino acid adenylation domain-containing protein